MRGYFTTWSMSRGIRRLSYSRLAAAGLLFCSGARASPAELEAASSTPDVAEAELSAAQAYHAYQQKDYASAVALYEKAFDEAPSADALFNIARVYDYGLRDRPLAIAFYRRYVSDPGATPERIKRVNERLIWLREAEVAELEANPATQPVVELERDPHGPVVATASPPPEQEPGGGWSSLEIASLASAAAGAAALSVGVGYGVSLLSTADRANRECDGNDCSSQRGVDASRAAARDARDARWANYGLGVGGGLLAGATLMWLLDRDTEQAAQPGAAKLAPIAGAAELGVALSGRW